MNDEEQASFEKDRAHLPKKLTGAQAWYGSDMLSSKKWIYSLSDQDIDEINNVASYLQTKFAKFMILLMKPTQDVLKKSYSLLPVQDFSKPTTDDELFKKYRITDKEIVFINTLVKY